MCFLFPMATLSASSVVWFPCKLQLLPHAKGCASPGITSLMVRTLRAVSSPYPLLGDVQLHRGSVLRTASWLNSLIIHIVPPALDMMFPHPCWLWKLPSKGPGVAHGKADGISKQPELSLNGLVEADVGAPGFQAAEILCRCFLYFSAATGERSATFFLSLQTTIHNRKSEAVLVSPVILETRDLAGAFVWQWGEDVLVLT